MIKVGDVIVLKDSVPQDLFRSGKNAVIKFPMKVTRIGNCEYMDHYDGACLKCPGAINGEYCFGYDGKYIVKVLQFEWDS